MHPKKCRTSFASMIIAAIATLIVGITTAQARTVPLWLPRKAAACGSLSCQVRR